MRGITCIRYLYLKLRESSYHEFREKLSPVYAES